MSDAILIAEGQKPVIFGLIRFMKWEYADSFRAGHVRLGVVEKYRTEYENNQGGRNDPDEHLGSLFQPEQVTVSIGGAVVGGLAGPVKVRRDFDECSYVLCMTAITDRNLNAAQGHLKLDKRLLGLGDAAVVVTDYPEFQRRLKAAIDKIEWLRSHAGSGGRASGLVEYVDFSKHHGDVGPFRKSDEFGYQHEWRLALVDGTESRRGDHLRLDVGDLTDTSFTMASEKLVTEGICALPKPD